MQMRNVRMEERLASGECLDVGELGRPNAYASEYTLDAYVDGKDYCERRTERWVWSIGKHMVTGEIRAAFDARFYQNPEWECLWLR